MRVGVVGASVAGVAACAALRDAGYRGEIVLIGAERHPPYDRPPLSKQFLSGTMTTGEITLPDTPRLADLAVERRTAVAAGLSPDRHSLYLLDETEMPFDGLIIATGSYARRLPLQPELTRLFVLRTLDDALGLRKALLDGRRLVVIGAGFIGLEVASSARTLGISTTVVEATASPMSRVFDAELGAWFGSLHAEHGVDVRCDVSLTSIIESGGAVSGVTLRANTTGAVETLDADVALVGIGASPATQWLSDSSLAIDDGVVCDSTLAAAPRIYAIGDVARWEHPRFGSIRVEHWTTARSHARLAAHNLVAELSGRSEDQRACEDIPYFWSDQHGVKIQTAGWLPGYDEFETFSLPNRRVALFGRDGRLVAVMAWDAPALVAKQRRAIAAGTSFREAVGATRAWAKGAD